MGTVKSDLNFLYNILLDTAILSIAPEESGIGLVLFIFCLDTNASKFLIVPITSSSISVISSQACLAPFISTRKRKVSHFFLAPVYLYSLEISRFVVEGLKILLKALRAEFLSDILFSVRFLATPKLFVQFPRSSRVPNIPLLAIDPARFQRG